MDKRTGTHRENYNTFIRIGRYANPEDFAFLILRVLELFIRKVCTMSAYKHTETIEYVKK